jgi:hypothetical protein
MAEFGHARDERVHVSHNSYLDLDSHWETLLRSLLTHSRSAVRLEFYLEDLCVVSLFRNSENNGLVVGDVNAPRRLVVMNTGDMHFDPCLPV